MTIRAPVILLKSGWQTVNIGDVAHTPGMLALLERHLPEAHIMWWPIVCDARVEAMIRKRFPRVEILPQHLHGHLAPADDVVQPFFERADCYLHGSGPNPMAMEQWRQWRRLTDKPMFVGGLTVTDTTIVTREELNGLFHCCCRETHSLQFVQSQLVDPGTASFGPDAAFASDVRDDAWARQFLADHDVRPGEFACFIGRLRFPPFHRMQQWYKPSAEHIKQGEALNAATAERDHAKLRHVLSGWVRQTGKWAVICPEMIYQLDDADALLYDPLPADVKEKTIVFRDWWCTDQAAALYRQARLIVSMKMHSPVLAQAQGVPSLHIRQQEDTAKGQMWRDIGLADWLFEIDEIDGSEVLAAALRIDAAYPAAQAQLRAAQERIDQAHAAMMAKLRQMLPRLQAV